LEIVRSAAEATVLGNLAVQLLASGLFASSDEMLAACSKSWL
jgi:hypothetical protein